MKRDVIDKIMMKNQSVWLWQGIISYIIYVGFPFLFIENFSSLKIWIFKSLCP